MVFLTSSLLENDVTVRGSLPTFLRWQKEFGKCY